MLSRTALVQAKGQITIPAEFREKLNVKKGDRIIFIETSLGVVIQPAEVVVSASLDSIGKSLNESGVSLEQLITSGREVRGELLEEEYSLSDSETE